jgi:hypothetical protein
VYAPCSLASDGPVSETLTRQLQDISAGLDCISDPPFALSDADSRPSFSSAALDYRSRPFLAPDAPCSTKPKPTLRRLSFTKCVKLAPLATVFSKLSPSPSRARSARDSLCGLVSRLEPILPPMAGGDPGAVSTAEASKPGSGAAAPVSPSRFTTITSIEAVRAPDSPVPLFPSPKLSTESVFGSTQSLASLSETGSGPRCPRSSSIPGVRKLKRKDTIRRSVVTYTGVQPVLWST